MKKKFAYEVPPSTLQIVLHLHVTEYTKTNVLLLLTMC